MPTIGGGTVGTGGTYPTWAAWFAAAPNNLVAADVIWRGRQLNEELVSAGTLVNIQGKTVDSTHYFEMTAEAGASFVDHVDRLANPLRYDASKGAAMRITGDYASCVRNSLPFTRINRLQMSGTSVATDSFPVIFTETGESRMDIDQCIVEGYCNGTAYPGVVTLYGSPSMLRRSVVLSKASNTAASLVSAGNAAEVRSCVIAALNALLTIGVGTQYLPTVIKNTYIGGCTAPDGGGTATVTSSATSAAAGGYTTVPMSAATFENVILGTHDFRLKLGSALIGAGTADATYAPVDIFGTAKPQGSTYDIGAQEYPIAGAPVVPPNLSVPTATPTSATTATGTVATDKAGGTLFYLASANPTETAATIKAGGSQVVTATGTQTVNFSNITTGSTRYPHYVQTDSTGADSAVANGGSFTMPTPDTVAPGFPGGSAITPGAVTSSTIAYSYSAATDNVGVAKYQTSINNGATWQDDGLSRSGQRSGLAAATTYPVWARAVDAQNNFSVPLQTTMTTGAAVAGSFAGDVWLTTAETVRASQPFTGTWYSGGVVGSAGGTPILVSGTLSAAGIPALSGLPNGPGFLLGKAADGSIIYEDGTVA